MKKRFVKLILSVGLCFSTISFNCSMCDNKSEFGNNSNVYEVNKKNEHDVILSSTKNTRDLGGYVSKDNKNITRKNIILRSDHAESLSSEDIEKLNKLPVALVIDFRNQHEIDKSADAFASLNSVKHVNIPMHFTNEFENIEKLSKNEITLDKTYIDLVSDDSQKFQIKQVFDEIANVDNGAILIHCSFGKDRTGIISALILGLCGVNDSDIINNFSVTQELLNSDEKDLTKLTNLFSSDASIMKNFIDFIEKSGGYEKFLLGCGVEQKNLDKIKSRLLEPVQSNAEVNINNSVNNGSVS